MTAIIILISILSASFVLAMVWSYVLVYRHGLDGRRLDSKRLGIAGFIKRTRLAIANFVLMSAVTVLPLLFLGDGLLSLDTPSVAALAGGFVLMLVLDDVWFYAIHRLMHRVPFLYRHIHVVHHRAMPPIPLDYLFAHPIEAMGASMGLLLGLAGTYLLLGEANLWILALYATYRTLHELCLHSGLRLLPHKWLGPVGSSRHHYLHHKHLTGNYASGLTLLDRLFKTEIK